VSQAQHVGDHADAKERVDAHAAVVLVVVDGDLRGVEEGDDAEHGDGGDVEESERAENEADATTIRDRSRIHPY